MENRQYYFDAYFEFIEFVDNKIKVIKKKHKGQIRCKKDCSRCCMETSVLPIEFFSILSMLKNENIKPDMTNEKCSFLKDSRCQIYELRPLICRTHGLPLAYGKDVDPLSKNISYCELNFTKEIPEFNSDNTLDMDEINIELVRLNEKFLKSYDGELPERMALADLADYL
ncbi:MAG: YkgJ family cysteine cluster protein [Candidatus Delongbacteria bacterium]